MNYKLLPWPNDTTIWMLIFTFIISFLHTVCRCLWVICCILYLRCNQDTTPYLPLPLSTLRPYISRVRCVHAFYDRGYLLHATFDMFTFSFHADWCVHLFFDIFYVMKLTCQCGLHVLLVRISQTMVETLEGEVGKSPKTRVVKGLCSSYFQVCL